MDRQWEEYIMVFSWIAIFAITFGGLIILSQYEQIEGLEWAIDHNERTYDTLMNACDNAYKSLVVDYKACKSKLANVTKVENVTNKAPIIIDITANISRG